MLAVTCYTLLSGTRTRPTYNPPPEKRGGGLLKPGLLGSVPAWKNLFIAFHQSGSGASIETLCLNGLAICIRDYSIRAIISIGNSQGNPLILIPLHRDLAYLA